MLIASLIFILTLTFVIVQPKIFKLEQVLFWSFYCTYIWVVTFSDVLDVTNIVWDATLAFIGIIILSLVLDEIGFLSGQL